RDLGFPSPAQLRAALPHVSLGFDEVVVLAAPLDHVARATARDQIARVLLSFSSARHDEINRHGQRVIETTHAVESAVLATVLIAFQDVHAFSYGYRLGYQRQGH